MSDDRFSKLEKEEVEQMLERMERTEDRYDRKMVAEALERFKSDTGYDFFELMRSEELQAELRAKDALVTDTDEDTDELMKIYEPWVWKMFMEADDEE